MEPNQLQPQPQPHAEQGVIVLEDADTGSSARILASYGFNCYSFCCRTGKGSFEILRAQDHFAEQPSRASGNGIPILFPFPNRIRAGRFEFNGREFELPRNERGTNAIHGLVIDRPWRVAERSGSSVTGQFHLSRDGADVRHRWPADFIIEMTYTLQRNRLTSVVRVTNPDSTPLPWGFGTHPYFRFPFLPESAKESSIVAPVTERWELEELLPTGRRSPVPADSGLDGSRPASELTFDDVFTGLQFQGNWCHCSLHDRRAGVEVQFRFDRLFRELVIYTPPGGGAICLEPYTCVTDAINLERRGIDAGLRILAAGEQDEGTMVIEVV